MQIETRTISPCHKCFAACCKQNGHEFAALLQGEEVRKFSAFAQRVMIQQDDAPRVEHILPYVAGKCQFLGEDDLCTIYEDRPAACRAFECAPQFHRDGSGHHGEFLQRNPRVLAILQDEAGSNESRNRE